MPVRGTSRLWYLLNLHILIFNKIQAGVKMHFASYLFTTKFKNTLPLKNYPCFFFQLPVGADIRFAADSATVVLVHNQPDQPTNPSSLLGRHLNCCRWAAHQACQYIFSLTCGQTSGCRAAHQACLYTVPLTCGADIRFAASRQRTRRAGTQAQAGATDCTAVPLQWRHANATCWTQAEQK